MTAGDLDASIEQVLPLMEAELFGDVAETKEEAAFANKYKEAKALKAYDTYLLLASQITFATHLDVLLIPVRDRLPLAAAPRVRYALYHRAAGPGEIPGSRSWSSWTQVLKAGPASR